MAYFTAGAVVGAVLGALLSSSLPIAATLYWLAVVVALGVAAWAVKR
ncbi:MAG: hypothetical protein V2J24_23720 [Pseudomonadales bacterium]|nr:hypothetical protein [Pseudomonadales bacterium]